MYGLISYFNSIHNKTKIFNKKFNISAENFKTQYTCNFKWLFDVKKLY